MRHAFGFDDAVHGMGVELFGDDQGSAHAQGAERREPASPGVEHRHEVEPHIAALHAEALHDELRIAVKPLVMQHRAFRETRCAGGVLHLGGGERRGHRERQVIVRAGEECILVLNVDHGADVFVFACNARRDFADRIAAKRADMIERGRLRLLEDEFDFACLKRGIDRHDREARVSGGVFRNHPFGDIGGPDRDPLARSVAGGKGLRKAARGGLERAVGPAPPDDAVGGGFLQGNDVTGVARGQRQHVGDRIVVDNPVFDSGEIRLRQLNFVHILASHFAHIRCAQTSRRTTSEHQSKDGTRRNEAARSAC